MRKSIYQLFSTFTVLMLFSFATAAQRSRPSVSAAEVTGTFRKNFAGKFKTSSSDIKILALGGGKLRVAMDLIYPYTLRNGEMMANMGTLDDEATIDGDTAVFTSAEIGKCTITIKFVRPGTIKVSQEGTDAGCGFGHNVSADGTYKKVSSKRPKFEER
jgi:hypothetical protein